MIKKKINVSDLFTSNMWMKSSYIVSIFAILIIAFDLMTKVNNSDNFSKYLIWVLIVFAYIFPIIIGNKARTRIKKREEEIAEENEEIRQELEKQKNSNNKFVLFILTLGFLYILIYIFAISSISVIGKFLIFLSLILYISGVLVNVKKRYVRI
ncbi:MAG: hypothetical protein FWF14_02410 [Streptococcaceae bacterium]|nr:hypothetical protein [Streptococcaceae bacterium]